jgi:acyl carrier protein
LIVLVDEKYGKKLTADIIRSFVTVSDILNYCG